MDRSNREQLLEELSQYVAVLMKSAEETQRSEDRQKYTAHLASAAVIFHHLQIESWTSLQQKLANEKRSFGWDYLDGIAGVAAESAFEIFAARVDAMVPT
jgi:hypothetical protein